MTTSTPTPPAEGLRGACEVHLPGDPGYDAARAAWNLAVDQRPAAVAVPRSAEEVGRVVRAAVEAGLRVAPQSTGHGATALAQGPLDDVVIVRLSQLTGVTVDAEARTARVLGGTPWREVVTATTALGLTAVHGSAGSVAVAGYTLAGGISFYGRQHGLAVNSVRAVEVVTADGALVRADASQNADLFWAVRGGGGNLGVVIAIELDLLPYADIYAGMLLWDRERAPEVLPAWEQWTRGVPDSVSTSLRVMSFPPIPELPPFLSGRDLVIVDGAVLEGDAEAVELLAPLRALDPEMDTFARIPASGLLEVHMDPPAPVPAVGNHCVLGDLGEDFDRALLEQVGPGTRSGLIFVEVRQLGGAFSRPDPHGGALSHVPGEYSLVAMAAAPTPEVAAAGRAAAAAVVEAVAPWSQTALVPTFTEVPVEASRLFGVDAAARLATVRATLDPDRVFVANHQV